MISFAQESNFCLLCRRIWVVGGSSSERSSASISISRSLCPLSSPPLVLSLGSGGGCSTSVCFFFPFIAADGFLFFFAFGIFASGGRRIDNDC
ncbi:hypothetical protein BDV59DRAFT_186819 [Aspergillus ambiguus]|uniref:uncharacterized protein n=1 Tax=Aspergillus ambiguus TaxID=176160 RepID=UPI003CCCD8AC